MSENDVSESTNVGHKLKYCSQVLTKIKRDPNALPFLEPVDPVKLNIPDYLIKIKQPMDLSTIERKLDSEEYKAQEEFDFDVKLMFNNCYTYNSSRTVVYKMGKALESAYNRLMSMTSEELGKRKRAENSVAEKSRSPRRGSKFSGMRIDEFELCSEILTDLMKQKYKACNWPFLEHVDGALVPEYYSVIKEPMDLQTMRTKLQQKAYNSVEEFKRDLYLIVENCKKFNPVETEVYACGTEFEKVVKMHLQKLFPQNTEERIAELKKKIMEYTNEVKMLELRFAEEKGEPIQKSYNLSERISIGNAILCMNRGQAEQVAKIVQKHGAGEFVEDDEIEVDMRTIPDKVVEEIETYVRRDVC